MKIQDAVFICNVCKKEFPGQLLVDCSVKTFATAIKEEVRCPSGCGKPKQLALVRTDPVS